MLNSTRPAVLFAASNPPATGTTTRATPRSKTEQLRMALVGAPFSLLFDPLSARTPTGWRLKGSGTRGRPLDAPITDLVATALEAEGIALQHPVPGPMGLASPFQLNAEFLDGGLFAWAHGNGRNRRGIYVHGPYAALFVCRLLGVREKRSWCAAQGIDPLSLDELRAALGREHAESSTTAPR